jgi:hypothetical protein
MAKLALVDLLQNKPREALALWKQEYEAGRATPALGSILFRMQTEDATVAEYKKLIAAYMKGKPPVTDG